MISISKNTIKVSGDFNKTMKFLKRVSHKSLRSIMEQYGQRGVDALSAATPKLTGTTAQSWTFRIEEREHGASIIWENSNVVRHVNIALIIQYGHATRNGGWVEGVDYINPALQPLFDEMADKVWQEVTSA